MFFRFSQASNSLTPSSQFVSVHPQSLTPAEKVPEPLVMMEAFTGPLKRHMASRGFGSVVSGHLEPGVPMEKTLSGFPKYPMGTKFSNGSIMGEYGPYNPTRRHWQEHVKKNPNLHIWEIKASDKKLNVVIAVVTVVGFYMLGMSSLCLMDKDFCKFVPTYSGKK